MSPVIVQPDDYGSDIKDIRRRLRALESSPASTMQSLGTTGQFGFTAEQTAPNTLWTPITALGSIAASQLTLVLGRPCNVFAVGQSPFYVVQHGVTHAVNVGVRIQVAGDASKTSMPSNSYLGDASYLHGSVSTLALWNFAAAGTYTIQFAFQWDVVTTDGLVLSNGQIDAYVTQ